MQHVHAYKTHQYKNSVLVIKLTSDMKEIINAFSDSHAKIAHAIKH